MGMNNKGFIFTLAALLLLLFIVTFFGFQSTDEGNADLEGPHFRIEKMNNFLRDLYGIYLPQSIKSSAISGFDVLVDYMGYTGEYLVDSECEINHAIAYSRYDVSNYINITDMVSGDDLTMYGTIDTFTDNEDIGTIDSNLVDLEKDDALMQPFMSNVDITDIVSITLDGDVDNYNATVRIEIREESCGHVAGGYLFLFEDFFEKNEDLASHSIPLVDSRSSKLEANKQYYIVIQVIEEKSGEDPMLQISFGNDNTQDTGMSTSNYHTIPHRDTTVSGFYDQYGYLLNYMRDNLYLHKMDYDLSTTVFNVYQVSPFEVGVDVNVSIVLGLGDVVWTIENETVSTVVDLDLIADPLAGIERKRYMREFDFSYYVGNWFSASDTSIFVDFLQSFGTASYYVASSSGPSFLERFSGARLNLDGFGIESIITRGFNDKYSNVDYLFLNKTGLVLYNNVTYFDQMLIIDSAHCSFYNLSCVCGVNNITDCS